MRFLSFRIDNQHSFGALIENRVVDLGQRMSGYQNLCEVISAGALVRAKDIAAESSADYELKELELTAPITHPGKIICVESASDAAAEQEHPEVYLRSAESLVGHLQPLVIPLESPQLQSRGVLGLVIGSGGRRIPEKSARDTLAGVTLANDTTAGNRSDPGSRPLTQSKNFPGSGSIGPWLVTLDDITDLNETTVTTRINDQVLLQSSSSLLPFTLGYLISYLSGFMLLNPGDVILLSLPASETPAGESDCVLTAGDQVSVDAPDIGSLSNTVTAEVSADA